MLNHDVFAELYQRVVHPHGDSILLHDPPNFYAKPGRISRIALRVQRFHV